MADKQVRQVRNESYHQVVEHVGKTAAIQMAIAVANVEIKQRLEQGDSYGME